MVELTGPVRRDSAAFVEVGDGLSHPTPGHARAFLGLVRAGEQLDRALDAELRAAHDLSLRGFEVLLHLAVFAPAGHLRVGELVAQAPLSQSRVSRLVAELEGRGLVCRSVAVDDSRAVQVSITQKGRKLLREAQPTHYAGLNRLMFSRLSKREIVELGRITGKILASLARAGAQ